MFQRLLIKLLIAHCCFAQASTSPAAPEYQPGDEKIVWVSGPARPGDSVVLTGAFTTSPKLVRIARVGASETSWQAAADRAAHIVPVESVDSESLVFKVPSSEAPGVYAIRIDDDGGARLYSRVNLPEIYWVLGVPASQYLNRPDSQVRPGSVAQGGVLRVFGRSFGDKPVVLLTAAGGRARPLTVTAHGPWSLSAAIPADVQPGLYNISVQAESGKAGTNGNRISLTIYSYQPASPRTLNVRSFGASGDGRADDSKAIQSCLNQVDAKAAYTVVQFPPGRYRIAQPLTIPQHVYLEGSSEKEVSIVAAAPAIPAQWISGQGYFGLSKITVIAQDPKQVIASITDGKAPPIGHILLDRVIIQAASSPGVAAQPLITQRGEQSRQAGLLAGRKQDTVLLGGPDIRIVNTEIRSNAIALSLLKVDGGVLLNNGVYNGRYGWYSFADCQNLTFEESRISGTDPLASGGSYAALPGGISQNIYTAHNVYERLPLGNGEAITTDGPNGAYFGHIASGSGAQLLLTGDPSWNGQDWRGASVAILGGHGAGQYRLIRDFNGRSVQLERPFDIPPDTSSVVTIVATERHLIFEGNRITDAGVGIQLYGTAYESVIAGNTLSRSGGIYLHAAKYGGIQPNFFIQVLDNKITRRGSFKQGLAGANINDLGVIQVRCLPPSLSLGIVVRGNDLGSEAAVQIVNPGDGVHSALIEQNRVSDPQTGIAVQNTARSIVVHRP